MISYRKLRLKMATEGMTVHSFYEKYEVTADAIFKGQNITVRTLEFMINHFNCPPEDLIEYLPYPKGTKLKKDFSRFRELLKSLNIRFDTLSVKAGLGTGTIQNIFFMNAADYGTIVKIARFLDVDPCSLYDEVPDTEGGSDDTLEDS